MKSTDIIKPTPLIAPIANDGLKNTIPDDATGSNYASIAEGFPEMTMKAPKDGGLPPWGQDFNGMFYLMSSQTCFLQNGGLITFDQDVSNKIGGYPQGAILDYMTPENTYVKVKSLIDDNTYNFVTTPSYIDGEHWEEITISATTSWGDITGTLSNQTDLTDYVNQSKALETGSVSSDADVYADIQKYAHSTFDLSKFEVVGSPVITEDGIASGFSESNNIRATYIPLGQNFKIFLPKFNSSDVNTAQIILRYSDGNIRAQIYNGKIRLWRFTNINEYDLCLGITSLSNNKDYYYYIEHTTDGEKYYFKGYISTDGINWIKDVDFTSTNAMYDYLNSVVPIQISGVDATQPFEGTIDLKSIAVWADGVPVFSGNKTGIDVIKPDNFEVVGTPTITEDGIASGFNGSNYPNLVYNVNSLPSSWGCTCKGITSSLPQTNSQELIYIKDTIDNNMLLRVTIDGNTSRFVFSCRNSTNLYTNTFREILPNTQYTVSIKVNGNNLTITLNDEIVVDMDNFNVSSDIQFISFGQLTNGVRYWQGSIDLNSIKVYINGNLVYQPCLKIPYTLSKTGSKIVDAAYRDRVQDMYEQYGYAPYYTIDEENENFTLPMGEIYGIIEQKKSNDGFSLFDTKFTDRILTGDEAVGWALQGSLITMTYPDAVNKIKELYAGGTDTTFRGISCKKTTDGRYIADISQKTAIDNLFNTTGVADFYILDSTNSEFYLPRNNWFLQAGSDTGAVNNYNAPGLPGISGNIGKFDVYEGYANGCFTIKNTSYSNTREQWGGTVADIGFNASQSSSVYGASSSVQPPSSIKLLYYKVGNTVPNTGLIDIGHVLSDIQQLSKSYITETYINGSSWYRVWSDGWIEQGGRLQIQASTQASVNLMKPYSDTNYAAFSSHSLPGTGNQAESYIQQTSASVVSIGNSCGNEQTFTWMCAGK